MKRLTALLVGVAALSLSGPRLASSLGQQQTPPVPVPITIPKLPGTPDGPEKKFADFATVIKGAKEYDGLFKLHHKDDNLYMEIQRQQFDRPLLAPIAIARGMGMGGYTLNFEEQWVLLFRRVGDRVHLIRRNVRFTARAGSPTARAVETTYTDSVLMSLRIVSLNMMRDSVLINLNDIFMTDFAQLGLGFFDSSRSSWHKIKAFPRNLELQVSATYGGRGGGGRRMFGNDSIIDARGTTVVIHYGLVQLPEAGYQPRLADDRVGHFLSVVKDFSNDTRDTAFLRYVNRWRLERAEPPDPKNPNKLSPPKKRIVFWIEKSVPDEYRACVREGILEWNKAFEKIGFRDAIEVRQQEDEDFDPEDVRYSTFRWITTGEAFAMGPSRANPLTGEILDADIIFDADFVRYWKQEYRNFRGTPAAAMEEPASPIQAIRQGWGLPDFRQPLGDLRTAAGNPAGWNDRTGQPEPDQQSSKVENHFRAVQFGLCQCGAHKKYELGLGAMAMAARDLIKPGEKVPDDLIQQAIKEVVMHEVGHTLGLRHNFKASTMLKNEQLNDLNITRKQGLVGSVMDYNPINLAPKGTKQGDYFTTTIGPYDYWAIEYAYKPLTGGTETELAELQKIAAKCAQQGLDYGTDEDMFGTSDPLIQVFDLGADPMKFAQERMQLAEELLKDLAERVVDKGEGYQKTRQAFNMLLSQYGNAAYLIAQFVGAEHLHRDHRGDSSRDPLVPVKAAKQREALKLLQEHILTDRPFQFSPQLLRKLAADRWWHWGNEGVIYSSVEFPLNERILSIQRVVLRHMFDPSVLSRIQNSAFKADKDEQPLTVAEVFRSITDGIWKEYQSPGAKPDGKQYTTSILRRNLQREHLRDLTNLVLGRRSGGGGFMIVMGGGGGSSAVPPDARSLARMHLRDINRRIEQSLKQSANGMDDTTRAHLEECQERIGKVLAAAVTVNDP